jgi:hypothetical protein
MNNHLRYQPRIQKLVHLRVVGENQALLAKAAPVADADRIAV